MTSNFNGFALVELILITLILAIFLALSVPAMAKRSVVESEAKRVSKAIELLSMRALYQGSNLTMSLNRSEIFGYDPRYPNKRLLTRTLHPSVRLISERKELNFYHQGVASPATVSITDNIEICIARVSLRGRVSLDCRKL